jgi:hypothetical protein
VRRRGPPHFLDNRFTDSGKINTQNFYNFLLRKSNKKRLILEWKTGMQLPLEAKIRHLSITSSLFQTDYFLGVKRSRRETNNPSSAGIKIRVYCLWRRV